jgi:hypothetical protein
MLFINLFVTLAPSNIHHVKKNMIFGVMSSTTYILQFNGEVLWPSHNVATLWHVLCNRCKLEGRDAPEPYQTVRRRIIAEGIYKHVPLPGWEYKIVQRDMLRKPGQRKLPFEKETSVKQSAG